ncbi:hypothetical protein FRC09_007624 [Ceratobasidium sp. 395]|nr:hypothetical protein FRC09_007624 [Ceratobasidium sp. 395]
MTLAHTLSTITPEDLRKAAVEEAKGQIVSNPAVRVLKQHVTATARRVMASGPKRTQLRSQVRSAAIYFNQPTIWLTINPDNLHDPIAQIFAGEEIDMDAFIKTAGPDSVRWSQNIARDPVAAAKFFHFTITMMLEKLFGVSVSKTRVHSQKGVLGRVKAYFGTVECQGRGTLHLHMLIWLHNVPPPRRLKEMLQTEEFRARVLTYIAANVRSFRPELRISKEVKEMRAQTDIAYSCMPDPALPTEEFSAELEQLEKEVVLAKQIHRCDFAKCLRVDRLKKVSCKRGWPWELSGRDAVNQNGAYLTKCSNPDINTYCPAISHVLKCNQDIKILLHGDETLQLAYYISKYMTKHQQKPGSVKSPLNGF